VANPTVLSPGDQVTAWVYIVPGSSIDGVGLELGENIGGGVRAWWGTDTFDWDPWSVVEFRIRDLPPAGAGSTSRSPPPPSGSSRREPT
jgi:hypothetical protein